MQLPNLLNRVPLAHRQSLPMLDGATGWLNSEPLTPDDLQGRVVLVDFWTYTCVNWIRTLPYLRRWAETYPNNGLAIIGVHTPEFTVEHRSANVHRALHTWGIQYPVAIDNDYAIWDAFANQYWPALYLADGTGQIRHQLLGERGYERTERVLRRLLAETSTVDLPPAVGTAEGHGIEAAADWESLRSPETYLGWTRSRGFASPGGAVWERPTTYQLPDSLALNEWALAGTWTVQPEAAVLAGQRGTIAFRFQARDLNLVLAPSPNRVVAQITVRVDGEPPRDAHGLDVGGHGQGTLAEPRLYQLVRQHGPVRSRLCEIEISGSGAAAYCFTFG